MEGSRKSRRLPPRPPGETEDRTKGVCVLCVKPVLKNDGSVAVRRSWHDECSFVWSIMNNPTSARQIVYLRDGGKCARCGTVCDPKDHKADHVAQMIRTHLGGRRRYYNPIPRLDLGEWELDHITPLWTATPGADHHLWQMGNMQTLCCDCHKAKTAEDMKGFYK